MQKNIGENKIECIRNQKGGWTANFTLYCDDLFDGVSRCSAIIYCIEEMIEDMKVDMDEVSED